MAAGPPVPDGGGVVKVLCEQTWRSDRPLVADDRYRLRSVAYSPKLLADFGKVRPRGPLRLTFAGEHKPTLVAIGERFVGAIQPVKESE